MRQDRSPGHTLGLAAVALALGLGATSPGHGAGPEPAVVVEDGRVTLTVPAATPRVALLAAIGRVAGVAVVAEGDLGQAPPQRLQRVGLAVAIRRLVGADNRLLMRFARQPGGEPRLLSVRAESRSGTGPERRPRLVVPPPPAPDPDVLQAPGVRLVRLAPEAVYDPEAMARLRGEIQDHGRQADAAAVAGLAAILVGEHHPGVRRLAANTLVAMIARLPLRGPGRQQATSTFVAALDDASSGVRMEALRGLRLVAGRGAVRHMASVATSDPDPELRRQAVGLLAPLRGARDALDRASTDADPGVRLAAVKALRHPARRAWGPHP